MSEHFRHDQWLAQRVQQARDSVHVPPKRVAVPGAKAPVDADLLEALLESGRDHHEVVEFINRAWEHDNAERLAASRQWREGPYRDHIEQAREAAAEAAALALRRQALIDEKLREG